MKTVDERDSTIKSLQAELGQTNDARLKAEGERDKIQHKYTSVSLFWEGLI